MNKARFILVFALFVTLSVKAQQNNIWYFGRKAALSFNVSGGQPVPTKLSNSAMLADEATGTISDENDNLLFYTNGVTVYNRLHQVMLNGDNLDGNISTCQLAIVPMPGNDNLFYIFTTGAIENDFQPGYRYSVVDITGDNGNGEIISKNTLLWPSCTERTTSVRHSNGIDVWLITNDNNSNIFRSWLITCGGILGSPVISTIGTVLDQHNNMNGGILKVSPDGRFLCQTHFPFFDETLHLPNFFQMFDFNNSTGVISNDRSIFFNDAQFTHCEFSPDSKLLYLTRPYEKKIDQFEITLPTITDIKASRISFATRYPFYSIQSAPDDKIYLAQPSFYLSVINQPNVKGSACNFREEQVDISPGSSFLGLPSFINEVSASNPNNGFSYTILDSCSGIVQFFGNSTMPGTLIWLWDFGDGSPTSSLQSPIHTFTPSDQLYTVKLKVTSSISCGVLQRSGILQPKGIVTEVDFDYVGNCDSGYVRFINKFPGLQGTAGQYTWYFGDGTTSNAVSPTHIYSQPGNYPVKLKLTTSTSCLDDSLTKTVVMPDLPLTISGNQTIFIGQQIQLFVNGPGNIYQWSPATGLSNTTVARPLASPVQDITYKAIVINNNGCSGEDSVHITVADLDGIYVPTAFTPNNDGKNDDIKPLFGTKFTLKEFSIFDRWGERVFTTSTRNEGWTGKINGIEQNSGVYVWILRFVDDKGKAKEKKGTVILIR